MNIFLKLLISLSIIFFTVACQTNNSDSQVIETPDENITEPTQPPVDPTDPPVDPTDPPDENTTDPVDPALEIDVVLPVTSKELTLNSEVVNIAVTVLDANNNLYSEGSVKIVYPDDIRTGRDIGYFLSSEETPVNGRSNFVYTAPVDLSADTSNLVFKFYHSSNPTETVSYTMSINPETNQTVITNYELKTGNPNDVDMELESSEVVSYAVYDENDVLVPEADMTSITVTSLNTNIGLLSGAGVSEAATLSVTDKNNISLNIVSNTKSGIVPIKVDAQFKDANGDDNNLTKVFNMLVLSGPPSAISLAYAGTEQDGERAKFIERWVVTVTDRYSNKVNTNPAVSMGMIAGYAKSSDTAVGNDGNYTYYAPGFDTELNTTSDKFISHVQTFGNVDDSTDILVLTGTGYKYPALGKWDISVEDNSTLKIIDDYDSNDTTELGFAVGNNQREETCDPGVKWIANVSPADGQYIIEDTGSLAINVDYDYYLVGKSTMLWVNLVGIQHSTNETIRIGEARKITLRGLGLETSEYSFAKGFEGIVRFDISISDTVEFYKNANFGSRVEVSGEGNTFSIPETSMSHGITSCVNNGVAYIDVDVNASGEAGVVKITNILPSHEF